MVEADDQRETRRPAPRSVIRRAFSGWSRPIEMQTTGTPCRRGRSSVPWPPCEITAAHLGTSRSWGALCTTTMFDAEGRSPGRTAGPVVTIPCTGSLAKALMQRAMIPRWSWKVVLNEISTLGSVSLSRCSIETSSTHAGRSSSGPQ